MTEYRLLLNQSFYEVEFMRDYQKTDNNTKVLEGRDREGN